jgi:two-component system response regulator AtoC
MKTKPMNEIIREVEGEKLIGESPAIQEVMRDIAWLAPLEVMIILAGETGVGKDLVARLIHANSRRRHKPFVGINCANVQDDLLESEWFGSTQGAFTGAETRPGLFRQAAGGTLYLNELQDLSHRCQAKLKAFLDSGDIRPVGGNRTVRLDVRVMVGTHGHLEQMVKEKALAHDLYERLGHIVITIPPLRQRREDIPALVEYFLERLSRRYRLSVRGLTEEARRVLMEYDWPGNVRELQKVVAAAGIRSEGSTIEAAQVIRALRPWAGQSGHHQPDGTFIHSLEAQGLKPATEAYEREAIEHLLARSSSLREAARRANLRLSTLQYKIKTLGLEDRLSQRPHSQRRNTGQSQ